MRDDPHNFFILDQICKTVFSKEYFTASEVGLLSIVITQNISFRLFKHGKSGLFAETPNIHFQFLLACLKCLSDNPKQSNSISLYTRSIVLLLQ